MINISWQNGSNAFIDAVASSNATPGGGSVAGATGALGCALIMMAVSVTIKTDPLSETGKTLNAELDILLNYKEELQDLSARDAKAYENVIRARKLPKTSVERPVLLQEALEEAAKVPVDTARKILQVLEKLQDFEPKIAPVIKSDTECGKHLLKAAIACCRENIKANLPYIKNAEFKNFLEEELNFLSKF